MNISHLKVATRLTIAFGTVLVLLIVVLLVGLSRMSTLNDGLNRTINDSMPKMEALQELAFRSMDNARIIRNMILITDEQSLASNKASFEKNSAANTEAMEWLHKNIHNPRAVEALNQVDSNLTAYRAYIKEVVALSMQGKKDEATKTLYGDGYKKQISYFTSVKNLLALRKALSNEEAAGIVAAYQSARLLMIITGALACLVAVTMAILITRGLVKQLGGEPSDATELARKVAQGDLSTHIHIKSGDSTSMLAQLAVMKDKLAEVVSAVRNGSDQVSVASAEIAQGNHDLSSRTEQQASALEETAASMEELSSAVKNNADNARQADQLAKKASSVAIKGGEVVTEVVATMKDINDSSNRISDIISVIEGIAFQTNILALNAAVEAARAGEQGRGFAVVASEVRSLAGRSADAAKEIKTLIHDSVERVTQGSALVDQAGRTMSEVVSAIAHVTEIVEEISTASSEQAQGVMQMGDAVTQMEQMTQQNAALVEQMSAAASSLRSQSQDLVNTVGIFKLEHNTVSTMAATSTTAYASSPIRLAQAQPRSRILAA